METISYKTIRETSVNDFYKMPYKIKCKGLIFKKEYNNYYSKKYSLDDIAHYGDICEIIEWEEPEEEQEMTAKEMFEKLGFTEMCSTGTFTIKLYRNRKLMSIYFDKDHTIDMEGTKITIELLQAINKQVEELGWNK